MKYMSAELNKLFVTRIQILIWILSELYIMRYIYIKNKCK